MSNSDDAVGMPWVAVTTRRPRDFAFRVTILRLSKHRCAVCGYHGQLDNTDLGMEAAHIGWRAAAAGAVALSDARRILISEHVRGGQGV